MQLSRRSFLRTAGASLLTLVAAPTMSIAAMAEKSGGVKLATQADAMHEMEKFDRLNRTEKFLKDPESYYLMKPNDVEKYVLRALQTRARRDSRVAIGFEIRDNITNTGYWHNIHGKSFKMNQAHDGSFYFSVGPLFHDSPEFRENVMDDVWQRLSGTRYHSELKTGTWADVLKMNGRELTRLGKELGYHRNDGKPEAQARIERIDPTQYNTDMAIADRNYDLTYGSIRDKFYK